MKLSFNVSIIQVYYKSHPKAWYKVIQMEREREREKTGWHYGLISQQSTWRQLQSDHIIFCDFVHDFISIYDMITKDTQKTG